LGCLPTFFIISSLVDVGFGGTVCKEALFE